jgi:predicted ferric reductase
MKRSAIGNWFIVLLVILNIVVWVVFPPVNDGSENFIRKWAGETMGSNNIVLMAVSLFLSTRPKWAEKFFGGLDKMYVTHRHTSTAALLLIFVHVLTVPISHDWRLGNYLAVVAFTGIVSIAMISLAPRMAYLNKLSGGTYEGWKKLKRYIGIFFILGFIHSLTVDALDAKVGITWSMAFTIIGTVCYLYTEIFGRFFGKYVPYTVQAVNHPNGSTTEVVLRAKKDSIPRQRAGQFLFVRFPNEKNLNESHPFTISSAPGEDVLRLTIKASGDFTRALFGELKAGVDAIVEGAYGMFNYKTGGQKQIWIAGGIGVTPFLSFIRDMDGSLKHDVDFYFTVRHPEEAIFTEEIEAAAKGNPRLKPHVRFSSTMGSLTIEHIVENAGGDVRGHHVYLCGPLPMTQAFEKKFLGLGVPQQNIHFEEFNFR